MFKLKIKDYDDNGRIVTVSEKEIYNLDGRQSAADWVREPVRKLKTHDAPQLTSAINFDDVGRGRICKDALGYMLNNANNPVSNMIDVGLFSSCVAKAHGLSIMPQNFNRVVALFAARKLVIPDWMNQKDQYMVPDTSHSAYDQFAADATVFSLFESKSQQSALRQVSYKGTLHDIRNEFFFMSVKEMQDLAVAHNFNDLYNDTVGKQDSYVYNLLNTLTLSPDAKAVLDKARELVRKSFPVRQAAHSLKPEFHLQAYDAGWYQIRNGILKDSFAKEYKEFVAEYKAFAARLKPLVYELGFLKP